MDEWLTYCSASRRQKPFTRDRARDEEEISMIGLKNAMITWSTWVERGRVSFRSYKPNLYDLFD